MAIAIPLEVTSTTVTGAISTAATHIRLIEWHARADNAGTIVVGTSNVSSDNGRELSPDERVTWDFTNLGDNNEPGFVTLSDLFCHINVGGDVLDWTVFTART